MGACVRACVRVLGLQKHKSSVTPSVYCYVLHYYTLLLTSMDSTGSVTLTNKHTHTHSKMPQILLEGSGISDQCICPDHDITTNTDHCLLAVSLFIEEIDIQPAIPTRAPQAFVLRHVSLYEGNRAKP